MTETDRMFDSGDSWQWGLLSTDNAAVYRVHRNRHPTVTIHPGTKLEHGAITGSGFVVGETITGDTSGRTGEVSYVGSGFVYVVGEIGSSAWDTSTPDNISGGTSGTTADLTGTDTSEAKIEESHSPHDGGVLAFKDWPFGNQASATGALSKTLYGDARYLRFSSVSGFNLFEVV